MRRLALKSERLTELAAADLASVRGAQAAPLPTQLYPSHNCPSVLHDLTAQIFTY
jgi:hypothetical protein